MELTIVETGEVVKQMTLVEAERITARIADKLDAIADNVEQVLPLIGEALTREAWKALGYPSPTAYVSDRFTGALTRLPVEVRRSVVTELSASGMSTRAIAPVVGVSHETVAQDAKAPVRDLTPAPSKAVAITETPRTFTDEPGMVQQITGTAESHAMPKSPTVVGMDGKSYTRPGPAEAPKAKRRPLRDSVDDAGWNIRRAVDRANRVAEDDRFEARKEEMATHLRSHLIHAVEVCQDLLDRLSPEGEI